MDGYTGYALRFISGKYQGNEFPLKSNYEVILGRGSELEVVLMEDMVSRHHAKLVTGDDYVIIQDLGSTNGTFVNGERIRKIRLREGDRILVGTSIMRLVVFEGEIPEEEPAPLDIPNNRLLPAPGATSNANAPLALGPASSSTLNSASAPSTLQLSAFNSPSSPSHDAAPSFDLLPLSPRGESTHAPVEPSYDSVSAAHVPSIEPMGEKLGGNRPELGNPMMAGDFNETPLVDLLELFATSSRNGVLLIQGEREGRLHIRNGRLVGAVIDNNFTVAARKAAMRILGWNQATFELYAPNDEAIHEHIDEDLLYALQEANRLRDDLRAYASEFPPGTHNLSIPRPLRKPLRELRGEHLDILQLVYNYGIFHTILDKSHLNDRDTYRLLSFLVKHGYVNSH